MSAPIERPALSGPIATPSCPHCGDGRVIETNRFARRQYFYCYDCSKGFDLIDSVPPDLKPLNQ